MKTIGIVAEYNPFHKGHEYMIREAKRKTNADRVVVVMSGNFVQRGEPAMFDKWLRTQTALEHGVDMVLELPVLFACANAETFASAAVRILEETGIVDVLCFGSESGELEPLAEASKLMGDETEEFRRLLKEYLDQGMSYPAARAKTLELISNINSEILSQPNDILALEYLRALDRYRCRMEAMTVKREGAGYHSDDLDMTYASASAIRGCILEGNPQLAMHQIPTDAGEVYLRALTFGEAPVTWDNLVHALHYKLRNMTAPEIAEIFEVTEGLENRILHSLDTCYSFADMIPFIKSKRYTWTKIQRIMLHILLDIKTSEVDYFMKKSHMPYVRVLGFRKDSADILGDLTINAKCPVLTNLKKASEVLQDDGLHLLAVEKLATDLYVLGYPDDGKRAPNQDFTKPMVII
ncbi:nucleotidyltransferase [Chakrabartyella piscis]|uniref:nucleotidyltransferase n=1 Tax=Chakrabartyella piscis TaxID=2918914 RepID=UPI002958B1A6|nr:nucleotidyltransferase [Chakrabartyella piscis]